MIKGQNKIIISAISLCLYALSGCYTEIELDIDNSNDYVVSTQISNQDTRHSVTVTFLNDENEQLPIMDATVYVEDENNTRYSFSHFLNGEYNYDGFFSSERIYRLTIELQDDNIVSNWRTFPEKSGEIDSLSFANSELLFIDDRGVEQSEEQVEFLVSFTAEEQYYALLDYNGIYEFISVPLEGSDPPPECWISEFSVDYLNPVTISPDDPPFLVRTDFTNTKFRKYNLIVEQITISEEEFRYWDRQNRLRQIGGNIFDPIPFSIDGNLQFQASGRPVFGFFSLVKYTSKRFAFELDDLPFNKLFSDCELDFIADGEVPPACADCRLFEFSEDARPSDWIEP